MMPTSFSSIVTDPQVWRFLGFVSSIVGFSCFALGPSFQKLFGQWNLLKIVVYCSVSLLFSVFMLFVKHMRERCPRVFWLKALMCFLVLLFTSLYSYYDDRGKTGRNPGKRIPEYITSDFLRGICIDVHELFNSSTAWIRGGYVQFLPRMSGTGGNEKELYGWYGCGSSMLCGHEYPLLLGFPAGTMPSWRPRTTRNCRREKQLTCAAPS